MTHRNRSASGKLLHGWQRKCPSKAGLALVTQPSLHYILARYRIAHVSV
jgi:hypothetical protein